MPIMNFIRSVGSGPFSHSSPPPEGQFAHPIGVSVDSAGNMYIVDQIDNATVSSRSLIVRASSKCTSAVPDSLPPSRSSHLLTLWRLTRGQRLRSRRA